MGNFEKLSVLVIVVIIVMILVVALYTWTDNPDASATTDTGSTTTSTAGAGMGDPVTAGGFPPAPPSGPRTPMVATPGPSTSGSGLATLPAGMNPLGTTGTSTTSGALGTAGTTSGGFGAPVGTTETAATDTTPSEPRVHVVASGDNLTKIAKKYFASTGQRYVDAIARANPSVDPNRLRVNQKLNIPSDKDVPAAAPRGSGSLADSRSGGGSSSTTSTGSSPKAGATYTVRRGDKLPDIARRAYGSSENWHLIWLENFTTIRDPDEVAVGTKLKIPHVH